MRWLSTGAVLAGPARCVCGGEISRRATGQARRARWTSDSDTTVQARLARRRRNQEFATVSLRLGAALRPMSSALEPRVVAAPSRPGRGVGAPGPRARRRCSHGERATHGGSCHAGLAADDKPQRSAVGLAGDRDWKRVDSRNLGAGAEIASAMATGSETTCARDRCRRSTRPRRPSGPDARTRQEWTHGARCLEVPLRTPRGAQSAFLAGQCGAWRSEDAAWSSMPVVAPPAHTT